MRVVAACLLLAPAMLHAQQLGVPMSSLPGVEAGVATAVGNAAAGAIEGVSLPAGALNRLLMAPTATGPVNATAGQDIERSFFANGTAPQEASGGFGLQGAAASAISGSALTRSAASGSVQSSGTAVQLPTSQQLMPANLIPGYQVTRSGAGASPTGVENVFTGTGIPRPGTAP
jgi:hypothetical protein